MSYIKTTWRTGDVITAIKLNNLENGVEALYLGGKDYDELENLPALNGVTIEGSKTSSDYYLPKIMFNDTETWSHSTDISEENVIYIYTDYMTDPDGHNIAGIKVGDGMAYIVDLPFTDYYMQRHMNDGNIHITPEERTFWNNKNRAYAYGETLILTDE